MNIAVLITCHNRREKTLRGLQSLVRAIAEVRSKREEVRSAEVHVFLVDDGSTDGTSAAVQEWYKNLPPLSTSTPRIAPPSELAPPIAAPSGRPSAGGYSLGGYFNLHLIAGSGDLFWAKGMALAWQSAIDFCRVERVEFDYYLWLNDDVELFPTSLSTLLHFCTANKSSVVIGETCDPVERTKKTYGMQGRWFNGNVVLVPREVCEKVGIIDAAYSHAKADFDYAERVRRAGIPIVAAEGFVGTCADDWREKLRGKSLFQRLALLWTPSNFNLRDLWRFQSRYVGRLHAILACLKLMWWVVYGLPCRSVEMEK